MPFRREILELFNLALPLILAQLAQTSMGFVDTLIVGRLGNEALAGIALGSTYFHLLQLVFSGLMYAVAPTVSQAFGAGRTDDLGRAVRQGFWLATLLFALAFVLLSRAEPILLMLKQNPETARLAASFLKVMAWGMLPALWLVPLRGLLEGISRTRPIMLISFIGVAFNILANYALVFGKWGFPKLGLPGTGLASSLAYGLIFLLLTIFIKRTLSHYHIFKQVFKPDFKMFLDLVRLGVPISLMLAFESGMFTTMSFLMGFLGSSELAAHQIAMQTASMTFMVPLGLSIATSIRVGQATGRGLAPAARQAGFVGMMLSCLFMCLSGLSFWLLPDAIVGLYLDIHNPANRTVLELASSFLAMAGMLQLFDGLQVSAAGALRGLKDTRIPMLITLVSYWLIGIGSGLWFCFGAGLGGRGLWLGLVVGLGFASIFLSWRFHRLTNPIKRLQSDLTGGS